MFGLLGTNNAGLGGMRATIEACERTVKTDREWRCKALPGGTGSVPPEYHSAGFDDSGWAPAAEHAMRCFDGAHTADYDGPVSAKSGNTNGYSSISLAMGFANVRAGTRLEYFARYGIR